MFVLHCTGCGGLDKGAISLQPLWSLSLLQSPVKGGACSRPRAPTPGPGSATLASIAGLCEASAAASWGGVVSAAGATWATVTSGINEAFLHQNQRN